MGLIMQMTGWFENWPLSYSSCMHMCVHAYQNAHARTQIRAHEYTHAHTHTAHTHIPCSCAGTCASNAPSPVVHSPVVNADHTKSSGSPLHNVANDARERVLHQQENRVRMRRANTQEGGWTIQYISSHTCNEIHKHRAIAIDLLLLTTQTHMQWSSEHHCSRYSFPSLRIHTPEIVGLHRHTQW